VSKLIIREAQQGDGVARVRIHGDMGAYYADLAPDHFQMPELDGLADVLDEEAGDSDDQALSLVAEVDGEAVSALRARLIAALPRTAPNIRSLLTPAASGSGSVWNTSRRPSRIARPVWAPISSRRRKPGGALREPPSRRPGRTTTARSRCRSGSTEWATKRAL